jgi:hypothetical protein
VVALTPSGRTRQHRADTRGYPVARDLVRRSGRGVKALFRGQQHPWHV